MVKREYNRELEKVLQKQIIQKVHPCRRLRQPQQIKVRLDGKSPNCASSAGRPLLNGRVETKRIVPFLLSRSHSAKLLWCKWPPGGRQRPDTGTTCRSQTVHHTKL